jgi:hypothetical protein
MPRSHDPHARSDGRESRGDCQHCHERPIPAGDRKYCDECSRIASRIWKRRFREECRRKNVPYRYEDPEPAAPLPAGVRAALAATAPRRALREWHAAC